MKLKSLIINYRKRIAVTPDGRRIAVVDGLLGFLVAPNEQDKKNGIPGDHTNCMYCICCRRTQGTTLVWITRMGIAYVEIRVAGDRTELQRYFVKSPGLMNIAKYDAGKHVSLEAVYFAPPTGSRTLDAMAEARRRRRVAKRTASNSANVGGFANVNLGHSASGNGPTKTPKAEAKPAYVKGELTGKKYRLKKIIESKTVTLRSRANGMFQFKER